jgi:hypothetical protein
MSGVMGSRQTARTTTGTTIMRRFVTVLLGSAMALSLASPARAQEIQLTGPLAGAPAVRHERLYRQGRFEIAPTVSFTLLDEYVRTIFVGGRLQYNLTDWFGFGVWGAYGVGQLDTDLTTEINATAPRNIETAVNVNHTVGPNGVGGNGTNSPFTNQVGHWNWSVAPQLQFTPFRGKLAIFEKIFVDTDAYLHGGVAFNGLQERENCGDGHGDPLCIDPKSFVLASRVAPAPTFGIGLHFYIANLISLGVEYRAVPFPWNRAGFNNTPAGQLPTNTITSADHTFYFNQMISIEVGFGLPIKPSISD